MSGEAIVTWPVVVLAVVTGLPAIIAAVTSLLTRKALKTENGKTVGTILSEVHAVVAKDEANG